ncbi:MAG: M56 family metallopeptidase [Flavobacteriaceae bacterium]
MELYLLKSAACLFLFFGFYKLILEKESMHLLKRFYLLGALIASFVFPLIIFSTYVEVPIEEISEGITHTNFEAIPSSKILETSVFPYILWGIYIMGVLFFGTRFVVNFLSIFKRIQRNPVQKSRNFITVLLNIPTIPHTFFQYIFLNKESFENRSIPQEVIWHEETHARELHSLDIVIIELLQVIFWFNPLFYFFKKAMKLNHEFLADQSVLKKGVNTSTYQKILLAFSSNAQVPVLAHAIHYSFIKKRFTVMKTHTSKKSVWLRTLLILPLVALTLYSFSTKKVIEKPIKNKVVYSIEKATPQEINSYNQLAKLYNKQPESSRVIPLSDLSILETIYQKMTSEQKEEAVPFPNCRPLEKGITIKIKGDKVIVNDKVSSVANFAKDLDNITKSWKEKDFNKLALDVVISNPNKGFMEKLEAEYKKTELYRKSPNKQGLIPPPPPKPDGKNVIIEKEIEEVKSENRNKKVSIIEEVEEINTDVPNIEEEIEFYNEFLGPEDPPPAPDAELPPPPPPPNIVEHFKELNEKGAVFYLEGKKISYKEALNIVKKSNNINIDIEHDGKSKPTVKLTKEPFVIED